MDNYFFEIPVYRCSKEKHQEAMALEKQKRPYTFKYYNWKYNEIIGWIGLCFDTHNLEFDCYLVDKARISAGIHKKEFVQKVWGERIYINPEIENAHTIVEKCCKKFNEMTKGNRVYKGRFIDESSFKACGIFLDWKHLAQTFNRIPNYKI